LGFFYAKNGSPEEKRQSRRLFIFT
jgi:hypothetical protein